MKCPDFRWVDFAQNGVNHRNNVVPIEHVAAAVRSNRLVDSYVTVYRFPDAYRAHAGKFGTVGGYVGPAYADYLPIDIDEENDVAAAFERARRIAGLLRVEFELRSDQMRYFFSGAKGFHILVPTVLLGDVEASEGLPATFKRMAVEMAQMCGEKIDAKIYDVNRLFRLPNSRHKSGLWKVELSPEEFASATIEQVRALAASPREYRWHPSHLEPSHPLEAFYQAKSREKDAPRPRAGGNVVGKLVEILRPAYGSGHRHELVLAFAGYAAKKSIPRETALGVVETLAADDDESRDRLRAVDDSYDRVRAGQTVAGFSELSGLLSEDAIAALSLVCGAAPSRPAASPAASVDPEASPRVSREHVFDPDRAGRAYLAYMRQLSERRINTGIPTLDRLTRGLMPGTVTILLAKARVGKSIFAQNVRRNVSKQVRDGCSIFFSLEMSIEMVWERDARYALGTDGHGVETAIRGADEREQERLIAQVSGTIPRSFTVDAPSLSIEDMERYCALIQAEFKLRPAVVLIDYLSLVASQGRDAYQTTTNVARGLKPFAKRVGAPIVMLAQVRRRTSDGEKLGGTSAPTLEDGRDSGAIEEGADFVIGAYRPNLDDPSDDRMVLKLLKNRLGPAGQEIPCLMDWRTLSLHEEEI